METEGAGEERADADETAGEEAARAAAAETGEGSGDRTDDPEAAGAPGAAPTADPSATATEAGEGSGDRTDDPEAAGAPGAAPTAEPSAASAEPGSEEPQPGAYLQAGDNIFIKLPWASSSRAPVEGETFDGEVLASAGLSLVDAPSSSSDEPEEERLLRTLLSLYRARQAKLAS